jgi:hypothetical protein
VPRAVARRLPFPRHDPSALVEVIERLAARGEGWVNIAADLGDGHPATVPGGWFSAKGPDAPHATYVPPKARRNGRLDPAQLGIEHASGPKAARQLAAAGLSVPAGWRVRQDHSKRGLVLAVPPEVSARDLVTWLLAAAGLLSRATLPEAWVAEVWEPAAV